MKQKKEIVIADDLFRAAWNRMYSAVDAYYLWKHLELAININKKGRGAAEKNVGIINDYSYFFHPLFSIAYKSFIIDIAIFFDKTRNDDSFSLEKLIASLKNKISKNEINNLRIKIEKIKKSNGVTIGLIQELRNTDVAHQKIVPVSKKIIYAEFESLIIAVQEILNLISRFHNDSFTMLDHIEDQVANDLQYIFDNLERGEKDRINEINKVYNY